MKNYSIIIFFSLLLLLFLFLEKPTNRSDYISEEVIPIREEDIITGIEYHIQIGKRVKNATLDINTHILDSIYHYKDISTIERFTVKIIMDNQSKYTYLLKKIELLSQGKREDISYQLQGKDIILYLNQSYFKNYHKNDMIILLLVK